MVYVDTSVVVSLLTLEPSSESVAAWFSGLAEMPVSSDWLLTEFSSAISIKLRTGQLSGVAARAVHREFERLTSSGLRLAPVSRAAFKAAADIARAHGQGLRSGDALHLALASRSALPLVSADQRLVQAAGQLGIPARLVN